MIYISYVTTYGDDWEHDDKYIYLSKEECEEHNKELLRQPETVNGVEHVNVEILELNEIEAREHLLVTEYIALFPKVEILLNNFHDKKGDD